MTYAKKETGPIITDELGNAEVLSQTFAGKIIKVSVLYNKPIAGTETNVKLTTIEEELIWDLAENNEDCVLYPRTTMNDKRFRTISWEAGESSNEPIVNVGPVKIEVSGAHGKGPAIANIVFTFEK